MKLPLLCNSDRAIRHVVSVSGGKDSTKGVNEINWSCYGNPADHLGGIGS